MKVEYKKAIVKMATSSSYDTAQLDIPGGVRVYAHAQVTGGDQKVMIGLEENGNEILTPLPSTLFDGTVGSFRQRGIELDYFGGGRLQINCQTLNHQPQGSEAYIIVTFLVIKEEEQC